MHILLLYSRNKFKICPWNSLSSSLRTFRLHTKIFLTFFFFSSEPNPKKINKRRDPSKRANYLHKKIFLFSRAQKFYVYAKQIWSFLSFYSQANVEKCFFFISRIAFFIFSLMRIFHLFCSVCAVQSLLKSQKNSHSPFPWMRCDA